MRWKLHLTPSEAAGLALGLNHPVIEEPEIPKCNPEADDYGDWPQYYKEMEAFEISEALKEEAYVWLRAELGGEGPKTIIQVTSYTDNPYSEGFDPQNILISKESIGNWFYFHGDKEKAAIFNPDPKKTDPGEMCTVTKISSAKESKARLNSDSLLEAVGLLSMLLAERSNLYKRGDKPNARQITEAVEGLARELYGLDTNERTGLNNLNKDIASGVDAVKRIINKGGIK